MAANDPGANNLKIVVERRAAFVFVFEQLFQVSTSDALKMSNLISYFSRS